MLLRHFLQKENSTFSSKEQEVIEGAVIVRKLANPCSFLPQKCDVFSK